MNALKKVFKWLSIFTLIAIGIGLAVITYDKYIHTPNIVSGLLNDTYDAVNKEQPLKNTYKVVTFLTNSGQGFSPSLGCDEKDLSEEVRKSIKRLKGTSKSASVICILRTDYTDMSAAYFPGDNILVVVHEHFEGKAIAVAEQKVLSVAMMAHNGNIIKSK